jgi:hypothetical protein
MGWARDMEFVIFASSAICAVRNDIRIIEVIRLVFDSRLSIVIRSGRRRSVVCESIIRERWGNFEFSTLTLFAKPKHLDVPIQCDLDERQVSVLTLYLNSPRSAARADSWFCKIIHVNRRSCRRSSLLSYRYMGTKPRRM